MFNQLQPIVSICITSYNRVNELIRCLNSIDSTCGEQIEIIISEDCSPQRQIIINEVGKYIKNSSFKIKLNLNKNNLGYDGNLGKLISIACGKYILFISDDDMFIKGALDKTIKFLKKKEYGVLFNSFVEAGKLKRKYKNNFEIESGAENAARYIYDSILFSGLIFRRELVNYISAEKFTKLNYFQVYLFLSALTKRPGYYLNLPLVNCVGDGENAYGIAPSNDKNPYLANRKSIYSNLEFHKGLIKVIKIFETDYNVSIISIFEKEYSLRTYGGLSRARENGINDFNEYWNRLNNLDIHLTFLASLYYYLLYCLGTKLSDVILQLPKRIICVLRGND
jgi:glycosyltransferase involved in cell wall biosynthesis